MEVDLFPIVKKSFGQICQMDTFDYVFYTQQCNNDGLISEEVF